MLLKSTEKWKYNIKSFKYKNNKIKTDLTFANYDKTTSVHLFLFFFFLNSTLKTHNFHEFWIF